MSQIVTHPTHGYQVTTQHRHGEPPKAPPAVGPVKRRPRPDGDMSTARKFAYREHIIDTLSAALALVLACAGELEAEYDAQPYQIHMDGSYEFDDPDHARAIDRQRQDALEMETLIRSLLLGKDDWFVVGWYHRFFHPTPDGVAREMAAIEAEMAEAEDAEGGQG